MSCCSSYYQKLKQFASNSRSFYFSLFPFYACIFSFFSLSHFFPNSLFPYSFLTFIFYPSLLFAFLFLPSIAFLFYDAKSYCSAPLQSSVISGVDQNRSLIFSHHLTLSLLSSDCSRVVGGALE